MFPDFFLIKHNIQRLKLFFLFREWRLAQQFGFDKDFVAFSVSNEEMTILPKTSSSSFNPHY